MGAAAAEAVTVAAGVGFGGSTRGRGGGGGGGGGGLTGDALTEPNGIDVPLAAGGTALLALFSTGSAADVSVAPHLMQIFAVSVFS